MKAWLKGGLIGAGVWVLYIIFVLVVYIGDVGIYCLSNQNCIITPLGKVIFFLAELPVKPFSFVEKIYPCTNCLVLAIIFVPIVTILEFFLIGAIIGFIVERIKVYRGQTK